MRWPWERRRSSPEPSTSRRSGDQPSPAGWAFLPPLQRTVGPPVTVSHPQQFATRLAAWADPSFVGPTTHLLEADAPAGVIDVDGGGLPGEPASAAGFQDLPLHTAAAERLRTSSASPATVQRAVALPEQATRTAGASATPEVRTPPELRNTEAHHWTGPKPAEAEGTGVEQPAESVPLPLDAEPSVPEPTPEPEPESDASVPPGSGPVEALDESPSREDILEPSRPQPAGEAPPLLPPPRAGFFDGAATIVDLPVPHVQRSASDAAAGPPAPPGPPHRLGFGKPRSSPPQDVARGMPLQRTVQSSPAPGGMGEIAARASHPFDARDDHRGALQLGTDRLPQRPTPDTNEGSEAAGRPTPSDDPASASADEAAPESAPGGEPIAENHPVAQRSAVSEPEAPQPTLSEVSQGPGDSLPAVDVTDHTRDVVDPTAGVSMRLATGAREAWGARAITGQTVVARAAVAPDQLAAEEKQATEQQAAGEQASGQPTAAVDLALPAPRPAKSLESEGPEAVAGAVPDTPGFAQDLSPLRGSEGIGNASAGTPSVQRLVAVSETSAEPLSIPASSGPGPREQAPPPPELPTLGSIGSIVDRGRREVPPSSGMPQSSSYSSGAEAAPTATTMQRFSAASRIADDFAAVAPVLSVLRFSSPVPTFAPSAPPAVPSVQRMPGAADERHPSAGASRASRDQPAAPASEAPGTLQLAHLPSRPSPSSAASPTPASSGPSDSELSGEIDVVQRATEAGGPAPAEQAPDPLAQYGADSGEEAAVQRAAGAAAPAAQVAGGAAATSESIEALADRLLGPLTRRLKAEMLLDRERRGVRTDVR